MQILLVFYIIMSIAEIFSVGGFLTDRKVLIVSDRVGGGVFCFADFLESGFRGSI